MPYYQLVTPRVFPGRAACPQGRVRGCGHMSVGLFFGPGDYIQGPRHMAAFSDAARAQAGGHAAWARRSGNTSTRAITLFFFTIFSFFLQFPVHYFSLFCLAKQLIQFFYFSVIFFFFKITLFELFELFSRFSSNFFQYLFFHEIISLIFSFNLILLCLISVFDYLNLLEFFILVFISFSFFQVCIYFNYVYYFKIVNILATMTAILVYLCNFFHCIVIHRVLVRS